MVRSGHLLLLALVGAVTVGAAALRAQDKPLSQKGFSAAPPDGRASGSQDPGVGSDAGWSVTEDSKEGYRMSLPGDWSLRDLDGESVAPLVERMRRADSGMTEVEAEWVGTEIAQSIRLLATESSPEAVARGFGAIFLLLRVPVGGALSPVGLAEMVRKQERLLPAGPAAALRMSFSTVLSDGKYEVIRERRMYVLRGDYAYLLDLLSPEEGDEAYAAAFERICGSLEFTTPPPPLVQEAPLLRRCPGAVLDLDLVRVPAGPTGLTLKLPWPPAPSLVMPPDSLPSTVEAAADCV